MCRLIKFILTDAKYAHEGALQLAESVTSIVDYINKELVVQHMGGSLVETEQMSFFVFVFEGLVWKPIMLLGLSVVDMLPTQFATKWRSMLDSHWIGSCHHIK